MPKNTYHTFVISAKMAQQNFIGFIDMLRYDAARVIDGDTSMLVLQTTNSAPTAARWASFRLHVLAEQKGDYPDTRHLREQARDRLPL